MEVIEEIKMHKNKETQRFRCPVLHRKETCLILLYTSPDEGRISDIVIPKGSTTIAHYRQGRGFVIWRMYDSAMELIGTLFHICKDVIIAATQVSYCDLIVDIWIAPDGTVRILDEDELQDSLLSGLVTPDEQSWIERQKQIILDSYPRILDESIRAELKYTKQFCLS